MENTEVEITKQDGKFGAFFELSKNQLTQLIHRVADPTTLPIGEDALEEIQTTALQELFREAIETALGRPEVSLELVAQNEAGVPVVADGPTNKQVISAFAEAWESRVGVASHPRIGKMVKAIRSKGEPVHRIARAWMNYLEDGDPKFLSPENFMGKYISIREGTFGKGSMPADSDWKRTMDALLKEDT